MEGDFKIDISCSDEVIGLLSSDSVGLLSDFPCIKSHSILVVL